MESGDIQSLNEKLKEVCEKLKRKVNFNRNILLINTPKFNSNAFEIEVARNRCYYAFPPTGIQYLVSSLNGRGLNIEILDLNYEFLKRISLDSSFDYKNWIVILKDYLKTHEPSIIGIGNVFSLDTPYFVEIARFLRSLDKRFIIIAGGQSATYNAENFLEEDLCDFVCKKECENKINFLLDHLYESKMTKPTPEIAFKYNGEIVETGGEKDIVELKGNLIDVHHLIPVEEYYKVGTLSPYSRIVGKDKPFATIVFNRGCHGGCRFCGVCDFTGGGVRSRNVKDFLDEMEYLSKVKGIKHFELLDDDFARYKDRAIEVLQGIIDRKLGITWSSNNGMIANTLNEEVLGKMRDSGCTGFKIGVETGNQEMLIKVRKPGTLKGFREFSERAKKFPEMFVVDNYIIGFPDETFSQIMDTYHFSTEMNLDWSAFSVYQHEVNFFGDEESKKKKKKSEIGDFIPTKDLLKGKIDSKDKIFIGMDIFNIPSSIVPNREQLSHIWFTFNLIRNFIQNKNLMPDGRIEKFISWVEVIQERYPTHPYITLFLALGYLLENKKEKTERYYKKTLENLRDEYWKDKFNHFGLMDVVENFPSSPESAKKTLEDLRQKYKR